MCGLSQVLRHDGNEMLRKTAAVEDKLNPILVFQLMIGIFQHSATESTVVFIFLVFHSVPNVCFSNKLEVPLCSPVCCKCK